jgi:DNA-3-methyladenine glycosylase I
MRSTGKVRCQWCEDDPLYVLYHDTEWGVPVHDDQKLFEFLILDGAQAGLSWLTILKKRENYRRAFDQFDPVKISGYSQQKIASLLDNAGIVRNKLKILSAVTNARAMLVVQTEKGSFSDYLWQFVDGSTIKNRFTSTDQIPASTRESEAMSRDLKQRGFRFVGPTICYAFMQAAGMVNDHIVGCFRYDEV